MRVRERAKKDEDGLTWRCWQWRWTLPCSRSRRTWSISAAVGYAPPPGRFGRHVNTTHRQTTVERGEGRREGRQRGGEGEDNKGRRVDGWMGKCCVPVTQSGRRRWGGRMGKEKEEEGEGGRTKERQ